MRKNPRRAARNIARGGWARSEIERLDPVADNERITHLSTNVRFGDALLVAAAYTLTFARQVAVPSIAAILDRGGRGDSITGPRKRHRDTILLFAEIYRRGHSSELGERAIAHLNAIHSRFPISNDDYLYTLATVIFEPERLARQVGSPAFSENERIARFVFWGHVAAKMGIQDVPQDANEFERWSLEFERERYSFTSAGKRLVEAAAADFAAYVPAPLKGLGAAAIYSLFDEHLCETHRVPRPSPAVRAAAVVPVRAYLFGRQHLPDPPERLVTDAFCDEYGPDFDVQQIGPKRPSPDPHVALSSE